MAFLKIETEVKTPIQRLFIDNARKVCAAFSFSELEILEKDVKQIRNKIGADLMIGRGTGHIWIHENGNPKRMAIITLKRLQAYGKKVC